MSKWVVIPTSVQLSPASGTVYNHYPRTTTLNWQAVSGATDDWVEVQYSSPSGCNNGAYTLGGYPKRITSTSFTFSFVGAQSGR